MAKLFTHYPPEITALLFGLLGIAAGRLIVCYADRFRRIYDTDIAEDARSPATDHTMDDRSEPQPIPAENPAQTPPHQHNRSLDAIPLIGSLLRNGSPHRLSRRNALLTEIGTGLAFTTFVGAMLLFHCQQIEMVTPSKTWHYGRILFHLILITLLISAAVTDLIDYLIPDEIPLTGVAVAIAGAAISGDLQIVHLWFDWNLADTLVGNEIQRGAYIPQWIKQHQHLHGVAWSLAGLVAGAGIIWLLRTVSSLLLGQESLGFGDVTLMAMVGSFIGWQPVCFVILLAPLCGLLAGFAVKIFSGRTFIAFGPYLCLSTFLVLCSWRRLWEPNRDIFGHLPTLAMLSAAALGGLIVLLLLLRLYRAIPIESHRKQK